MICKDCAWEADEVKAGYTTAEQLAAANTYFTKVRIGHAACKGGTHCDCHHGPTTPAGERPGKAGFRRAVA